MFSSVEIREVMWIFRLLGSVPVLLLAFWLGRLWERWERVTEKPTQQPEQVGEQQP